jgi:hypothetical protein
VAEDSYNKMKKGAKETGQGVEDTTDAAIDTAEGVVDASEGFIGGVTETAEGVIEGVKDTVNVFINSNPLRAGILKSERITMYRSLFEMMCSSAITGSVNLNTVTPSIVFKNS